MSKRSMDCNITNDGACARTKKKKVIRVLL